VKEGQEVSTGDLVCVIEAMKMENEITAHKDGKITALNAKEGAAVNPGDVLAKIE
jgi:acetyl-CoA/propionyl-CoA carboxylase biotin carboxyl carrier protein